MVMTAGQIENSEASGTLIAARDESPFPPDQATIELVERTWAMYRWGRISGIVGLALAGAIIALFSEPERPAAVLWPSLLVVTHLCMLLAWYIRSGTERARLVPTVWRLAYLGMGCVAALGWAGTLGEALMTNSANGHVGEALAMLGMAIVVVPLSHWLPSLLAALSVFALMLVPDLFMTASSLASHRAEVTGHLMLMVGMGMLFAWAARQSVRHEAIDQMTRREIGELQDEAEAQERRADDEHQRRVEIEEELNDARQLAKAALNAKTEFLATMSHEIRTPLNGIVPILEILQGTDLDEEQRQHVNTAHSSSRHLLRIINDILDFAKADSGKIEFENIEISIRELVESVTDLMYKSAERRGLALNVHVGEQVPAYVRGDPIRIRQILTNLVSNAIKFTETGSITIDVSPRRSSKLEVELLFSVTDTGIGMSQETSRRLFQVFTQADASTTRKHGGTGLGLAICKRLVELMGGSIGVRSRLDEGSTFWFMLPFRKSTRDVPAERHNLQGVRVLTLLAKSEDIARVGGYMRDWGVLENQSESASEALDTLRSSALLGQSWAYKLVLADYHNKRAEVEALLAAIQETPALYDLRILLACGSSDDTALVRRVRGVVFIEWPIKFEQLRRQMYRLFDVEGGAAPWDERHERTVPVGLGPQDVLDDGISDDEFADGARTPAPPDAGPLEGRVLIVEDNPVNLRVAAKLLERLGLDYEKAVDGREAVERTAGGSYDLVLMDVQMPFMDGLEATTMIRERERFRADQRLPIVAMTANAMAGDRERCLEAGMDDYVAKPLSIDGLRRVIQHWLERGVARQTSVDRGSSDSTYKGDRAMESSLDQAVLAELRDVMEDEFPMVLETYIGNAPVLFGELEAARVAGDVQAMVLPAHSLKSSSANVGAVALSEAAKAVETAARSGDLAGASRACDALREPFDRSLNDLRAMLTR